MSVINTAPMPFPSYRTQHLAVLTIFFLGQIILLQKLSNLISAPKSVVDLAVWRLSHRSEFDYTC